MPRCCAPDDLSAIDSAARPRYAPAKFPARSLSSATVIAFVYRKAFGFRARQPKKLPMTADTIFDLASLTKVIATTTAVMQLVEQGQLQLDDPIAKYWPEFAANGKEAITVRQVLTHYTGLRPDLPNNGWSGYRTALAMIAAETPVRAPGSAYEYSDINFEMLGELVQRVSGQPLDLYCRQHIFLPLGMHDTQFKPAAVLHDRIAPTVYWHKKIIWGEVNDPTALQMGGVAGHAGLFSSADDLAIFARMLLHGGSYRGATILKPESVAQMTSPQAPARAKPVSAASAGTSTHPTTTAIPSCPRGFYGHTGYTGTSLWIDPVTHTYVDHSDQPRLPERHRRCRSTAQSGGRYRRRRDRHRHAAAGQPRCEQVPLKAIPTARCAIACAAGWMCSPPNSSRRWPASASA